MFEFSNKTEKEKLNDLLKIKLVKYKRHINSKSFQKNISNLTNSISKDVKTKMQRTNYLSINKLINSYNNKIKKNLKTNNNLSITSKYLPKRLINMSKAHNILSPMTTRNVKLNLNEKNQKALKRIFSDIEYDIITFKNEEEIDDSKFRNEHLLKFSDIMHNFNNFKKNVDIINELSKEYYKEYFDKVLNSLKTISDLLFNSYYNLLKTESKKIKLEFHSFTKKLISINEEHNLYINKFINLIFKELNNLRNNNIKLTKISSDLEIRNNYNITKLDELNKFVERPEISEKIFTLKQAENKIKKVKLNFRVKENEYIILVNKLKEEIKSLTYLLMKNKDYYEKYKENEEIIKQNKKEKQEMKNKLINELEKLNIQDSSVKDNINELNEKISELEKIIENMKEEKLQSVQKEYGYKMKIKEMENIINEKNENFIMLNEELNSYINLYYRQKI